MSAVSGEACDHCWPNTSRRHGAREQMAHTPRVLLWDSVPFWGPPAALFWGMVTGSFVSQALSINWSLFYQTKRGTPGEEMSPQRALTSRTAALGVLGTLGSSEVYGSSEMAEEDAFLWSDPFSTHLFLPSGVPGTGWLSHPKAPSVVTCYIHFRQRARIKSRRHLAGRCFWRRGRNKAAFWKDH